MAGLAYAQTVTWNQYLDDSIGSRSSILTIESADCKVSSGAYLDQHNC
jgi:hypothetical protein